MSEHYVFDPYVIPFTVGLIFVTIAVFYYWFKALKQLDTSEWDKIKKNVFSPKIILILFSWVKECVMECLLHRKIFRRNFLLGLMHMLIAFGWFCAIVSEHIREFITTGISNAIFVYFPIFLFDFLRPEGSAGSPFSSMPVELFAITTTAIVFIFLYDIFMTMILAGKALSIVKKYKPGLFGMTGHAKHNQYDKLIVMLLMLLFIPRMFAVGCAMYNDAEFYAAGAVSPHIYAFLSYNFGQLIGPALASYENIFWWIYSFCIGAFFVALPFTRYMHIPTEILLIFLRKCGVVTGKKYTGASEIEVLSCPRCGVCVDRCQLNTAADIEVQPIYMLEGVRDKNPDEEKIYKCLLCERCESSCPVDINIANIRVSQREELNKNKFKKDTDRFNYLDDVKHEPNGKKNVDMVYFAGCMTHRTPGTKKAMTTLLDNAGVKYMNLDAEDSICCGQPLILSGMRDEAQKLIAENTKRIKDSGAKIFVTSCPVCYNSFRKEYDLEGNGIRVLHHTQYLNQLANEGKLKLHKTGMKVVFHDPCELGRIGGEYEAPRDLLRKTGTLIEPDDAKEDGLCCGGSIANTKLTNAEERAVAEDALNRLLAKKPDVLITACPLCKKTFAKVSDNKIEIMDISEFLLK
jgi:Fe-S oxidoreductase